jgi:hypothetical protein
MMKRPTATATPLLAEEGVVNPLLPEEGHELRASARSEGVVL